MIMNRRELIKSVNPAYNIYNTLHNTKQENKDSHKKEDYIIKFQDVLNKAKGEL